MDHVDREERARAYAAQAVKILNTTEINPQARALLLVNLAQVEATLAILEKLEGGTFINGMEEVANAMNYLAGKLPDR